MGFFSYLFGKGSHSSKVNINEYKYISKQEILDLVSPLKIKTLTQQEEKAVEEVLIARLSHYREISLKNIRDILTKLSREYVISDIDRKYLYKTFVEYFSNKKNKEL